MATRQVTVQLDELHILMLANMNAAISRLQVCDIEGMDAALIRMGELRLAFKEALAAMPKPANGAAEGKRA